MILYVFSSLVVGGNLAKEERDGCFTSIVLWLSMICVSSS